MLTSVNSTSSAYPSPSQGQGFAVSEKVVQAQTSGTPSALDVAVDVRPEVVPQISASAPKVSEDTLKELNDLAAMRNLNIAFSLDKESGEQVVKVIDKETEEVVRQIPSEELLKLHKAMRAIEEQLLGKTKSGLILNDSA